MKRPRQMLASTVPSSRRAADVCDFRRRPRVRPRSIHRASAGRGSRFFGTRREVTKLSRRVLYRAADSARLGALVLRTPRVARAARRAADRYLGGVTLEQAVATID